mgnify:CR=1 FL=1
MTDYDNSQPRTFHIDTLGCKANQYDSQRLAESLRATGLTPAHDDESPDIVIVNSCTITHRSDRKCRKRARRAARDNPDATVIITGCYADSNRNALEDLEGVDAVFSREHWPALLEYATEQPRNACTLPAAGDYGVTDYAGRTRAVLKIQEGCDHYCSYCIVPSVRGPRRSRSLEDAVQEARRLAEAGFAEVVLTGIHLGQYGEDTDDAVGLADAVRAISDVSGLHRLRLSSIKADEVTDDLLAAMQTPGVCLHLHLPLQSGDDRVLQRMERGYTVEQFLDTVRRAREALDRPAITSDVMAGFPGETDEMFENTLDVCRRARFSRIHVFPFSARKGTKAAEMTDKVHSKVKKRRCRRLQDLAERMAAEWAESFVGERVEALFEQHRDGCLNGYTARYTPIEADGPEELVGAPVSVECRAAQGDTLWAEVTDG